MAKAKVLKFDAAGPGLSKPEILKVCDAENVRFLRLQFTDIFGVIKNVEVPSSQFEKALDGEIQFDGSSIEGFTRIEESDMILVPDLELVRDLSLGAPNGEKVGRLICDVYNPDGTPFAGCPRMTLKKQMDKADGARLHAGDGPGGGVLPLPARRQRRPDRRHARRGRLLRPDARSTAARRRAATSSLALEAMGFEVEAAHHEVAAGPARDRLQVRRRGHDGRQRLDLPLHRQEGRAWTTACTPRSCRSRSSASTARACTPTSPSSTRSGNNVFYDPKAKYQLSKTAMHYIGGILRHARGLRRRSRTRSSTPTSGWCRATRRRSTSPGPSATARRSSACRRGAAWGPASRSGCRTRPATPTSPSA